MMTKIVFFLSLFLASFLATASAADQPKLKMRKMDLNEDGVKEATVYFLDGLAVRASIDRDQDGSPDGRVTYRNGHRDIGEIDSDYDGVFETRIDYYFTGVPAAIKIDRDGDGTYDSARYFKNGFMYKREWDRNADGQPDFRVVYQLGPDLRPENNGGYQRLVKQYDQDFDGVFDHDVEARRKVHIQKVELSAGSIVSA